MEKKLTAQGPKDRKSYTVTLPIEWVKKEKLDRIKQVELDIVGNKIIISPHKNIREQVLINGDDYCNCIIKVIQGLYRSGVIEIKLFFSDSKLLNQITQIVEKLIGYEIIEQKKDYIIIKEITKENDEDFRVIFRRIFLLLLGYSEIEEIEQADLLDKNIKKLINYCERILIKKGHTEFTKIPLYYLILDRFEKISDEFVWLLETDAKERNKQDFREINRLLRDAYELFYKFDAKKYNICQYKTYQLKKEIKSGLKVDIASIHVHNLYRLLNSLYGDIFTLKFDEGN